MTGRPSISKAHLSDSAIEIRRVAGTQCPPELIELRQHVWSQETGLLPEGGLFNDNDANAVHILVYDMANGGRLVASTCAIEAERSDFADHSHLPRAVLQDAIVSTRSTVHPDYRGGSLFPLLVYLGAREGRMRGRRWITGFIERDQSLARKITGAIDLVQVPPRKVSGRRHEYEVVAIGGEVNCVMSNCFHHIPQAFHSYLSEHCFVEEIIAEVERGAKRFHGGPWFQAVNRCELTKWQYFLTLANMHAYVRWTTRLLGTVVGITADQGLRKHYLNHLGGEIDHELMLENDIARLGFDVEYVKQRFCPSDDVFAFMSLQEALCAGPRRNPSLFLAVPLAMEALAALLPEDFLEVLSRNIASWGVKEPKRVISFLASHIREDGGTDGHWDAARQILHRHVKSEEVLQEFLATIRLVHDSKHRAFTSYVHGPDLFAAHPEMAVVKI
jgi:hypothetical protein